MISISGTNIGFFEGKTCRNKADAGLLAVGYHFTLFLPIEEIVVVLHTNEFVPTIFVRNGLKHLEFPCGHL